MRRLRRQSFRSFISGISTYVTATVVEPLQSIRNTKPVRKAPSRPGSDEKKIRVPYLIHAVANQHFHTSPKVTGLYIQKRGLRDFNVRGRSTTLH